VYKRQGEGVRENLASFVEREHPGRIKGFADCITVFRYVNDFLWSFLRSLLNSLKGKGCGLCFGRCLIARVDGVAVDGGLCRLGRKRCCGSVPRFGT